jgi:hypothetical protein
MRARVVTGQYCSVHQLLFVRSRQEWLACSPAHLAQACGDAMPVVEATCPRCLALAQTAMHRQFPGLYIPPIAAPETSAVTRDGAVVRNNGRAVAPDRYAASNFAGSATRGVSKVTDTV